MTEQHPQKFFLFGEVEEIWDLEPQDLKEPTRMNIKTEATIFLTLTATFFSFSLGFCVGSPKVLLFKEDNL